MAHVFFRCHNRQFFLKDRAAKLFLLNLWAKYKHRYQVKIFDFIIMDNHAHLLVQTPSAEHLGHFMRTVNSQLARYINHHNERDSQAIRERYKSPLITNTRYLQATMKYIWLNRYKVTKHRPEHDPFCSASWRLNSGVITNLASDDQEAARFSKLLDSYKDLPVPITKNIRQFVRGLLNEALASIAADDQKVFEGSHTIGDQSDIEFRAELLGAFRREEHVPWVATVSV